MSSTPTIIWNPASRLDPLYDARHASELPVALQGQGAGIVAIYPGGLVLGEVAAAPGLFAPYDPAATDGSQVAKMILRYRSQVVGALGAAGVITAWGGERFGLTQNNVPAFKSGDFDLARLTGLDAAALTAMGGSIKQGALGVAEVDSITVNATGGTWGLTVPTQTISGVVYPAVVVANTALAYNVTAANLATAVNAALATAGVPGDVTVTGGPGATNPLVVTFHGVYGAQSLVVVTDATLLTGGAGTAAVTRTTHGAVGAGVVRFG